MLERILSKTQKVRVWSLTVISFGDGHPSGEMPRSLILGGFIACIVIHGVCVCVSVYVLIRRNTFFPKYIESFR